ncbi:hypothetical protein GCM10009744_48750 [Kribbella alba]|uniref:DUF222 domain-containing protein n=1 Tax=Kribbella alba TaxID=190197 RepID=A0ABN2FLW8_9ACTN
MSIGAVDHEYGEQQFAADLDALLEAGLIPIPDDPEAPGGPRLLDEKDFYADGASLQLSAVDALEWELWAGVEQDEAERCLLQDKAPAWVFLPPGAELAAALEPVRPQTESPIALIEVMKASARLTAWSESIRLSAMAAFYRQRQAQATQLPRPSEIDSRGRPVDPERSWTAEIACALKLAPDTATAHLDTALRLTSVLSATHTALRCGAISLSKAIAISDATRALDTHQTQAVEAHVLKRAASQSHANLRASLRRQVAKHDTRNHADRHRDAKKDRGVRVVPLPDGMAGLWIVNTADKIQQIWIVIQAIATLAKRNTPDPTHTSTSQDGTDQDGTSQGGTSQGGTGAGGSGRAHAQPGAGQSGAEQAGPERAGTNRPKTDQGDAARADAARAASTQTSTGQPSTTRNGRGQVPDNQQNNQTDTHPSGHNQTRAGQTTAGQTTAAHATAGQAGDEQTVARQTNAGQTNAGPGGEPAAAIGKDERTADQRRADITADLFEFILTNGLDWLGRRLPDQHRRRPHIEVLIPINTLLGLDDDPGELTGYGPIPAEMARHIATNGTWRRILTDPTNGTVLEASTTRHDPGALVSETLLAAHPTCDWTNCNKPARTCDRDHGTPFTQTGITQLADLRNYCELHHIIKDTPTWGWKATNNPDGSTTLTTPTGHRYTTPPPAPGPIPQPPHPTNTDPPPF